MTIRTRNTSLDQPVSPAVHPAPPPAPIPAYSAASVRTAAVIAGAALTLMAALAGFGNFVAVQGLVTPGDAATTANDILASEGMFRLGVASLYLAALLDVVVAWALLRVFSAVNADLSRLDAWLRLSYAAVFMVAVSQLAGIPAVLREPGNAREFTTQQLQAQALAKVDAFHDVWFAGLVLFGVHLALAGYLAYRSGFVPRVIGVLLVVAGAGYIFDSFVSLFAREPAFAVASVTFLGEFLLGLWLLFRGRRLSASTIPST